MAGTSAAASSSSSLSIGDCEVKVEGDAFSFEQNSHVLEISVPNASTIKVSVQKTKRRSSRNRGRGRSGVMNTLRGSDSLEKSEAMELPWACEDYSFVVLNPKDADRSGKLLLQDVLKVYEKELPSMKYAANTGKESQFLERCVFGGKYCTLLLRSSAVNGNGEVIAAASYQIIFPDTQFAEVPVVAVCSGYQRKGIGCLLYAELRKRLQNIGVSTLFCWGDRESEGFWQKQVFGCGFLLSSLLVFHIKRAFSNNMTSSRLSGLLLAVLIRALNPVPQACRCCKQRHKGGLRSNSSVIYDLCICTYAPVFMNTDLLYYLLFGPASPIIPNQSLIQTSVVLDVCS